MLKALRLLLVCLVIGASACASNPQVYNVANASTTAPESATLKQIQQAILVAGTKRNWVMRAVEPGYIVATHSRGSHSATVDIRFDTKTFSITYQDSANLDYTGATIHSTYNRWVQYLERDIQLAMQTIS